MSWVVEKSKGLRDRKGPVYFGKVFLIFKKKKRQQKQKLTQNKAVSFLSHELLSKFRFLILDFRLLLTLVSLYLANLTCLCLPMNTFCSK